MTTQPSPWDLPGLDRWLDDLAERLGFGLLVLPPMAAAPEGLVEALLSRCCGLHDCLEISCDAEDGRAPAAVLAEPLHCAATLEALASAACDQQAVVLRLTGASHASVAPWLTFLHRLVKARRDSPGLCILVPDAPAAFLDQDLPCAGDWRDSLSRGDRIIWAEQHLPRGRNGLVAELAVSLAVELCSWRLDLAANLAQAGVDDLISPLDWLTRRGSDTAAAMDSWDGCPLALYRAGDKGQLLRRVWRAQLFAFFPKLEEQRLDFIDRYRKKLRIDDNLRSLRVTDVEEIELGALRYQLRGALDRGEANRLDALARLRNQLAHRQPGETEDCRTILGFDGTDSKKIT